MLTELMEDSHSVQKWKYRQLRIQKKKSVQATTHLPGIFLVADNRKQTSSIKSLIGDTDSVHFQICCDLVYIPSLK